MLRTHGRALAVFDNGNDRMYPSGQVCTPTATQTCPYSASQILNIDETNTTAAFAFPQVTPTYSVLGGNNEVLANQNVEYDLASVAGAAAVYEVTPTSSPETVWQMSITNASAYRAFRMPSLYPGVRGRRRIGT
jgi:arylsulfate sulfotransferase